MLKEKLVQQHDTLKRAHTYKMRMRKANKSGCDQKFHASYVRALSLAIPLAKFLDQHLYIW